MEWAYGIITVPARAGTLLPRTLASLASGGFDRPRLFVDGAKDASLYESFGLEIVVRYPTIRTFGNWFLALWELYLRNPAADRFALFQDDFVCYRNLRQYLEQCEFPNPGYWNLYTVPANEELAKGRRGWYLSNQLGKGAIALVFDRESARMLATSSTLFHRFRDPLRGWKSIDGGIVTTLREFKCKEYVHFPSLTQHTGQVSVMANRQFPLPVSFRGEEFDALELLKERSQ